jgi:hypothetical protein
MNPKSKKKKISRGFLITIASICSISVLIGYLVINSFTPVNYDGFIFESPTNIFLKALKSQEGYHFSLQSTRGGKVVPSTGGNSPTLLVAKGNLVNIHLINEVKNESSNISKHNLNIDEFNVHTGDLGYFQTKEILFLADKEGTFYYYCTIHPEMKGAIKVS